MRLYCHIEMIILIHPPTDCGSAMRNFEQVQFAIALALRYLLIRQAAARAFQKKQASSFFANPLALRYLCNRKGDISMEQSMQLQQTVLRGVVRLLDDNEAMKKLQKFIDKLVSDKEKCQEKQRVADDIKDSIVEMKKARNGEIKLQTVEDFLNEIRN